MANSDVFAISLIGHMAVVSWPLMGDGIVNQEGSKILQSHEFVSKRLRRKPVDISDMDLLDTEIYVLSKSHRLFGRPLAGKIAIPFAELFTNSDYPGVRQSAGNALLSMADCGVEAQSILIAHLNRLLHKLETDQTDYSFNMDKLTQLLTRLNTEDIAASIKSDLELPENKLHSIPTPLKMIIIDALILRAERLIEKKDYETAHEEINKIRAMSIRDQSIRDQNFMSDESFRRHEDVWKVLLKEDVWKSLHKAGAGRDSTQ